MPKKLKDCKEGEVRNPTTNRCVKVGGKAYKKSYKTPAKKDASSTKKAPTKKAKHETKVPEKKKVDESIRLLEESLEKAMEKADQCLIDKEQLRKRVSELESKLVNIPLSTQSLKDMVKEAKKSIEAKHKSQFKMLEKFDGVFRGFTLKNHIWFLKRLAKTHPVAKQLVRTVKGQTVEERIKTKKRFKKALATSDIVEAYLFAILDTPKQEKYPQRVSLSLLQFFTKSDLLEAYRELSQQELAKKTTLRDLMQMVEEDRLASEILAIAVDNSEPMIAAQREIARRGFTIKDPQYEQLFREFKEKVGVESKGKKKGGKKKTPSNAPTLTSTSVPPTTTTPVLFSGNKSTGVPFGFPDRKTLKKKIFMSPEGKMAFGEYRDAAGVLRMRETFVDNKVHETTYFDEKGNVL